LGTGPHANADNDKVGLQCRSAFELDAPSIDCRRGFLEMEHDAMLLVNSTDEIAIWASEHAFPESAGSGLRQVRSMASMQSKLQ
jgi:hypothetical protein